MTSLRHVWFVLAISALSITASALPPLNKVTKLQPPAAQIVDAHKYINANNLLGFIANQGNLFYDAGQLFGKNDGLYYPFTRIQDIQNGVNDKTVVFDAGLWMAGKVNGQLRGAIAEYSTEYVPGPMKNGTSQPDSPSFHVYQIYSDSGESNPNQDYLNWPIDQGAPVDLFNYPKQLGTQTLFSVYNDADPTQHTANAGSSQPLGIEVRQIVYADRESTITDSTSSIDKYVVTGGTQSLTTVTPWVADPHQITGHTYRVEVHPDLSLGQYWDLIDVTMGLTVLGQQTTFAPNHLDGVLVDGLRLSVASPRIGLLGGEPGSADSGWTVPSGARKFSAAGMGFGLGLEGFRGAVGWNSPYTYFNSGSSPVPSSHLKNILIKLAATDSLGNFDPDDPDASFGYRYLRNAQNPPAQPAFAPFILNQTNSWDFQAFEKNIPLSVWDVDANPPRRLTVGFCENNVTNGRVNGRYWPPYSIDPLQDNTSSSSPREWLFIFDSVYSTTPNAAFQINAVENPLPIMYMATWTNLYEPYASEDEFALFAYKGPSKVDSFTFTAIQPEIVPIEISTNTAITVRYDIYNKGTNNITDMYLAIWSDPDLGRSSDDLVACDSTQNIAYCYNAGVDDIYGTATPAVGSRVMQGPAVPSVSDTAIWFDQVRPGYRNLPATAFSKYINGTDPHSLTQTYNYMRGLNGDGTPYTFNGQPTRFMASGDPILGTGDLDYNPADRRMMTSMGPFNLSPGDSQQVIVKWGVGKGTDALSSVAELRTVLGQSLQLLPSPSYLNFVGERDSLLPDPQFVKMLSIGGAIPAWSVANSQAWLVVSQSATTIKAAINTTNLDFGLYFDTIVVIADGATNSPIRIPVVYEVVDDIPYCCQGSTGNVNMKGIIDLSDLTVLIDYLIKIPTPQLECFEEANVNGLGIVDLSDLTLLVAYLTMVTAPILPGCQ